jgi:hypothetical protein
VLVIAVVQGALGGLAFWALGLPSAVLWSVAMMFLSLIPMTGAFVVWVPAAIYLAVSGAWISAILLTLWGTLVIGIDRQLPAPQAGRRARQAARALHLLRRPRRPPGLRLLGIVLGPVVLAIAIALFDAFRHPEDANASASMIVMPGSVTPTMRRRPIPIKEERPAAAGPAPQTLDEKTRASQQPAVNADRWFDLLASISPRNGSPTCNECRLAPFRARCHASVAKPSHRARFHTISATRTNKQVTPPAAISRQNRPRSAFRAVQLLRRGRRESLENHGVLPPRVTTMSP